MESGSIFCVVILRFCYICIKSCLTFCYDLLPSAIRPRAKDMIDAPSMWYVLNKIFPKNKGQFLGITHTVSYLGRSEHPSCILIGYNFEIWATNTASNKIWPICCTLLCVPLHISVNVVRVFLCFSSVAIFFTDCYYIDWVLHCFLCTYLFTLIVLFVLC